MAEWDAAKYGGWSYVEDLGSGGQGKVYKVRSREGTKRLSAHLAKAQQALEAIAQRSSRPSEHVRELVHALLAYNDELRDQSTLGALKVFVKPDDAREADKARQRLENEIKAMEEVQHPGLLRLLAKNVDAGWIVTEYHSGGTLTKRLADYAGDARRSLVALRPVVEATAKLHERTVVHRDIKPDNIFVAEDGHLVLGDCGIVFVQPGTTRVTDTIEKVGTTDFMPGWAMGMRPDDVSPKFDLFALGKVLYCMVSGVPKLQLWYHDRPGNRLSERFGGRPDVESIQRILDETVRENEDQCRHGTGGELLGLIDEEIARLSGGGEVLRLSVPRACRICARGKYRPSLQGQARYLAIVERERVGQVSQLVALYNPRNGQVLEVRPFVCDACGHVDFFNFLDGSRPAAWQE
jgi:serine/threonine protein kinase